MIGIEISEMKYWQLHLHVNLIRLIVTINKITGVIIIMTKIKDWISKKRLKGEIGNCCIFLSIQFREKFTGKLGPGAVSQ